MFKNKKFSPNHDFYDVHGDEKQKVGIPTKVGKVASLIQGIIGLQNFKKQKI